jgi:peroxiredoxin
MSRHLLLVACLISASTLAVAAPSLERAPAPDFTVRSLDNRDLRLASLRRHGPVIVEFWAMECDSCSVALAELERWRRQYGGRGLSIVAFSADGTSNTARVRSYVNRLHIHFPVVIDEGLRVQKLYQASRIPTSYLVDRAGNIAAVRSDYRRDDDSFGTRLEQQFRPDTTATGAAR